MKAVRTHTFAGKKYIIEECERIDGICEIDEEVDNLPKITIVTGKDIRALHAAIHEAMEAYGVPDNIMHDENGNFRTLDIARFIWRLGWRRL